MTNNEKNILVNPLYAHLFILLLAVVLMGIVNLLDTTICIKVLVTFAFFAIVAVFSVDIPKYSARKE